MPKVHSPQTFCFHRLHPLFHPIRGLIKRNMLHFVRDMAHSVCLTVEIKYLIDYRFVWFPTIHQSVEDVLDSRHDLL